MAGIRVSKICRLFNIGPKELIAFLSTKGIMVSSNPNFKVPESAVEFLQEKYGHNDNSEDNSKTTIEDSLEDSFLVEAKTLSEESKIEPEKPLVIPDSPFKIGSSGKYKLFIKTVTNCIFHYEYILSDAAGKEYKAISDSLYSEGKLLRCMVNLKGEKGRLVVDDVAICKKQDLATPIAVVKKPEPKPIFEVKSKPKQKSTENTLPKQLSGEKDTVIRLGNPSKRLMCGIYYFRVTRYKIIDRAKQEFYCCLEGANGKEYTFMSKRCLKVGSIYPFKVNVSSASEGGIRIDVISVVKSNKKSNQRSNNQNKKTTGNNRKHKKNGHRHVVHYNNSGTYSQNEYKSNFKGGFHLIYTPMGNKR